MRSSFLTSIDRVVMVIERWLNYIAVLLIIFLMFFATVGVTSRYVFNQPLEGYTDTAELAMVVVVFFGLAYTQWVGGHVRVEFFINKLGGRRSYYILEFFNMLLSLGFFGFITAYGFKGALESYIIHDVSIDLYWPIWPVKICLAIGALVLCARLMMQMSQHLVQAMGSANLNRKA